MMKAQKKITYTMENKNNILSVNLETQTAPKVRESSSKEWVEYGVEDGNPNSYPQFLIDLYYSSGTHAAIINATSDMISGTELQCEEDTDYSLDAYVKLKKFMQNANANETLHEVIKKVAFDFKLQGGYALNIIWSKDKKSIAEIFHIPMERLRAGRPDETGRITHYWISSDWSNVREHEPIEVPAFNPNEVDSPNQILYTGRYSPNMDIYYVPDYVAGCNWALIDQNIAEFHLNNIQNGFAGSYFISFANGVPTQEERFAIEKSLQDKFTGVNASGRFVLTFSESKDRIPEITPIAMTNADKQYLALQELMTSNILVSHRVTSPMLMGIKNDTGLGSNAEELNSAFEVYLNTVIMPYQIDILKTLKKILDINEMYMPLSFVQSKPITSRFTIDDMRTVMTQDEIREELGLEALEGDDLKDGVDEIVNPTTEMSKQKKKKNFNLKKWLVENGEVMNTDEWELIDDAEVEEEHSQYDFESAINGLVGIHLATARASGNVNARGSQDGKSGQSTEKDALYRVRYYYNRDKTLMYGADSSSREFCQDMMWAADSGRVYKKEQLVPMSDGGLMGSLSEGANPGWGPYGTNDYNVFKYKGGGNCFHRFYRKIFKTRIGESTDLDDAEVISTTKARSQGFKPPINDYEVPVAPKQMSGAGFYQDWLRAKYG